MKTGIARVIARLKEFPFWLPRRHLYLAREDTAAAKAPA